MPLLKEVRQMYPKLCHTFTARYMLYLGEPYIRCSYRFFVFFDPELAVPGETIEGHAERVARDWLFETYENQWIPGSLRIGRGKEKHIQKKG